jgi:hypothetical protein
MAECRFLSTKEPKAAGARADMVPSGGAPSAMVYDVLKSTAASDFLLGALCLESGDGPNVTASDPAVPVVGHVSFYLVRAANACPVGLGSLGTDSFGVERQGRACP